MFVQKDFRSAVDSFVFNDLGFDDLKYAFLKLGLFRFVVFMCLYLGSFKVQPKKKEENVNIVNSLRTKKQLRKIRKKNNKKNVKLLRPIWT